MWKFLLKMCIEDWVGWLIYMIKIKWIYQYLRIDLCICILWWSIFISSTSNRCNYILKLKEKCIWIDKFVEENSSFAVIVMRNLNILICYMFCYFIFPQMHMNQMVIIQKLLVLPVLVDLSTDSSFQEHRHNVQTWLA